MTYAIFIWHGVFLSLTMSMIDFNTVFPSLVTDLVGSKVTFGILYSVMLGVPYLFSLVFGHLLSTYRSRRRFLLMGIYLRSLSFLGMAGFTFAFGRDRPWLVVVSLFVWGLLFSLSGSLAGIAYSDIIGKLVPKGERGRLYAVKQFASSVSAFGGGWIVAGVFSVGAVAFPTNYSIVLFVGFVGLVIASLAFWFIREPASPIAEDAHPPLLLLLRQIPSMLRQHHEFLRFIAVENLTSFSLMVMPFYMIFAKEHLLANSTYTGRYLLFQIGGTIISNLLWGLITSRFGAKRVVQVCLAIGGLIPLVAVGLSYTNANLFAIVFFLVGFVVSGRRVGFEPYLLDIIPAEGRPIYLGIRGTLNILVVILPLLGGLLIHFAGYFFVFGLVAAVMFAAFFLLKGKSSES